MIPMKRQEQTDREFMQELDGFINSMSALVRSDGWKRYAHQLEVERNAAWERMCAADTVDKKALAATEYATLKRMLEVPGKVMELATQAMRVPSEKPTIPGRR